MDANPYEPPSTPLGSAARDDFPDVTSVTFTLTLGEVNRAQAALARPISQIFGLAMLAIWVAGVFAILGLFPVGVVSLGVPPRIASFVMPIVIGLFFLYLMIKRLIRRDREPAPERTLEIHPDGVMIREEGSFELKRPWAAIDEIKDNGREIIFLIKGYNYVRRRHTRIDALPVPRRAFPAIGAAESFLRVAREFWSREHPSK